MECLAAASSPAPNAGRGRIQKGVRRAFLVAGTSTLTTSQVYEWTLLKRTQRHRHSVWRVLRQIAEIRRVPPYGAWLWRLKSPVAEHRPRRRIEIIGELATAQFQSILQTIF